MPRPLTLVVTHVLTTSLTTIVSWPLPPALDLVCVCSNVAWTSYICHSVYIPYVDGTNVRYRRYAQLWTRILQYRNAFDEN